MAQLDVEPFQPAGPQRVHRHGQHLHIRLPARRADQLHAALGNFAAGGGMSVPRAEYGLAVI
ncbi:hypothetical protein SDC9_121137 [bioreactor metagenome]|uniref:Uncharacterized protein n=1 Tax=bioreactor metagenome TaxID=1076179 RepID=A0A645CB91_9ZZZZ